MSLLSHLFVPLDFVRVFSGTMSLHYKIQDMFFDNLCCVIANYTGTGSPPDHPGRTFDKAIAWSILFRRCFANLGKNPRGFFVMLLLLLLLLLPPPPPLLLLLLLL